jgi:DNA polymerase-4
MVPFGSRGDFLHDISRGIDDTAVCRPTSASETIDYQHIFADDSNDQEVVEDAVAALVSRVGSNLRGRQQVTSRVGIWLRYSDGGHVVRQATCRNGTSGDVLLSKLALTALQRAWTRRTRIRSCRLVCDRLQRRSPQLLLFPEQEGSELREKKVLEAMDALRHRFGHAVIGVGRQGIAIKDEG